MKETLESYSFCSNTRMGTFEEFSVPKGFKAEIFQIIIHESKAYLCWKLVPLCFCTTSVLITNGCQCGGE